jgi:hypothetical protein
MVTAGLVAGAAPASAAPAPAAPERVEFRSIIDPVTGQEIVAGADLQTSGITPGVTRNLAGMFCRSGTYAYLIYFRVPYYELLRWNFQFSWCWQNKSEALSAAAASVLVVHVASSQRMILKNAVIQISGDWVKQIGRIPASVVGVQWQGMRFSYCPPTPIGCFGQFAPLIDVYLLAGGGLSNHSVL